MQQYLTRFESKFVPVPEAGCWLWEGATFAGGYGWFFLSKENGERKFEYAHRASWKLYNGEIPEGAQVLHKCDNRVCVNPNHLFLGTNLDNIKDRLSKNRPKTGTRGESHPRAKITLSQAREIKKLFSSRTVRSIAKEFGLKESSVSSIKTGRSWKFA